MSASKGDRESPGAYRYLAQGILQEILGVPSRQVRARLDAEMAPLLLAGVDPIEATADAVAALLDGRGAKSESQEDRDRNIVSSLHPVCDK